MRSVESIVFNVGTEKEKNFTAIYGVKEKCTAKATEGMNEGMKEKVKRTKTLFDVRATETDQNKCSIQRK